MQGFEIRSLGKSNASHRAEIGSAAELNRPVLDRNVSLRDGAGGIEIGQNRQAQVVPLSGSTLISP